MEEKKKVEKEEEAMSEAPPFSHQGGIAGQKRRSLLHATLLHVAIRIKYLFSSWFFLKPVLLPGNTAYPSRFTPEGMPRIGLPAQYAVHLLWLVGMFLRSVPILMYVLAKLRVMQILNWMHSKVMVCNDRV